MQKIGEICQKSITQRLQNWRTCRVLNAEQVYRDFIKRLSMSVYPDDLHLSDEFKNIIGQISLWYSNDERFKGDISKGILLRGNCGTGKTITIENLKEIVEFGDAKIPILIHSRELQDLYIERNLEKIDALKNRFLILIDDLGVESTDIKNFGNVLEPFNDVFDYRYRNNLDTVITTNLTPEKIKERYGDRILDRFKESFNEYVFNFNSLRK